MFFLFQVDMPDDGRRITTLYRVLVLCFKARKTHNMIQIMAKTVTKRFCCPHQSALHLQLYKLKQLISDCPGKMGQAKSEIQYKLDMTIQLCKGLQVISESPVNFAPSPPYIYALPLLPPPPPSHRPLGQKCQIKKSIKQGITQERRHLMKNYNIFKKLPQS